MPRLREVLLHHLRENGLASTLLASGRNLGRYVLRHTRHLLWVADCTLPRAPSVWTSEEQLLVLGPDNIDSVLTPELREFLRGDNTVKEAARNLEGVRRGDRVFVVNSPTGYIHYTYIFLDPSRKVTRREKKNFYFGELEHYPILGKGWTSTQARRRGLFTRIANEQLIFLQKLGYDRAVACNLAANEPVNKMHRRMGWELSRQLSNWVLLNFLVVQRIQQSNGNRWRIFLLFNP